MARAKKHELRCGAEEPKKLIAKSNEVPSGDSSNALVCTIDMSAKMKNTQVRQRFDICITPPG